MSGKKEASNESTRGKKTISKDLAEVQLEETEVWKAPCDKHKLINFMHVTLSLNLKSRPVPSFFRFPPFL